MRLSHTSAVFLAASVLLSNLATAQAVSAVPGRNAQSEGPAKTPADSAPTAAGKPQALIRQNLESRFPSLHVVDVQMSAMPGLYEVYLGDQIVYSDAAGDYVVMGPLVDTQTHQNLTEERLSDHGRINFSILPLAKAIKIVKGNGSRKFAVFSDPDCPFCQEFERTLLSVNDITMYVFLFPIATLHPQAPEKAHAIWCAQDRAQAWNQWMHEKKLPPSTRCAADPVDELQQLAASLHINSTPTMFFTNGRRVSGAIPKQDLEKIFAAVGNAPAQPAEKPTAEKKK